MNCIKYLPLLMISNCLMHTMSECGSHNSHEFSITHNANSMREIAFFITNQHMQVATLENDHGEKCIVKQESDKIIRSHMSILRDKLGAFIAQSAGIDTNDITIIPAKQSFPGKRNTKFPASLHSFAPGVQVTRLPKKLRWLKASILQHMKPDTPQQHWGLTRSIIAHMALHQQLPAIAAIDTFTANSDRNLKNYFYDVKTDRFCLIDFDGCFRKNLAHHCCKRIQSLLNNKNEKISPKELTGLIIYRNMLAQLIQLHTSESIVNQYLNFATEGQFMIREAIRDVTLKYIERYKNDIIQNYESCKKLVPLLDQLIMKHNNQLQ